MYLVVKVQRVSIGQRESGREGRKQEGDALAHQNTVHSDQVAGQRLSQELLLNEHSFTDDLLDSRRVRSTLEVREEQAGEVAVESLVSRYEFVGEGESGHKSTLLEPEDGSE